MRVACCAYVSVPCLSLSLSAVIDDCLVVCCLCFGSRDEMPEYYEFISNPIDITAIKKVL